MIMLNKMRVSVANQVDVQALRLRTKSHYFVVVGIAYFMAFTELTYMISDCDYYWHKII